MLPLPGAAQAFANGDLKKSVQVADGVSVSYGITASDVATGLMQALKDIADFDAGGTGNFNGATTLSAAQNITLTTGSYPVQSTWANDFNKGSGGCEVSHPTVS